MLGTIFLLVKCSNIEDNAGDFPCETLNLEVFSKKRNDFTVISNMEAWICIIFWTCGFSNLLCFCILVSRE
jgi:hypothetical protein